METIAGSPARRSDFALVLLYGSTIFLSAFLLFQVQPLMGKALLPWFGGSAAVWSTCLLFFQSLLLLGYLYAHLVTRLEQPRTQSVLHAGLLIASIALLPILPNAARKPGPLEDPTWPITALLAICVGMPYFLLCTTGPLLQAWFAREKPGSLPYRLFALSNFGSMLGLLSYPLLFEPRLDLPSMSWLWSSAYALFCGLAAILAWRGARISAPYSSSPSRAAGPGLRPARMALWALLAALASVVLMGVSSHLTQNVAPVPLLWVLPLALYLLTFILCFESDRWYRRSIFLVLYLAWLPFAGWDLVLRIRADGATLQVLLYLAGMFLACMLCHGELARSKPPASQLTTYYLMIALGGALGGSFVVLIAPRIFNGDHELPLALFAVALLSLTLQLREHAPQGWRTWWLPLSSLFAGTLAILVAVGLISRQHEYLLSTRNFYGTLKVAERWDNGRRKLELVHGAIIHGNQFMDEKRRLLPTSYYGPDSGVARALLATRRPGQPQRVGVVGLGTGTLAAWGRTGDWYRFYEINPAVARLARSHFSYLADSRATINVAAGDARLVLEAESPRQYHVLAVDAFTGDAIPVHLLTREAFEIYQRHVRPGGVIAVHVSNRSLALDPVLAHAARHLGWQARRVESRGDWKSGQNGSKWILLTRDASLFSHPQLAGVAEELEDASALRPWSDAYSSLFAVLK